ncbi:MAG: hypothetical protein NZ956_00405 [Candidatus Caldarchaeum sp.]|nr:hypothetical protein [Candidatus Caldarchaeum sp.]
MEGVKKVIVVAVLLLIAVSPFPDVDALKNYWLIGFGGGYMVPLLNGGVLEYGVGESLVVLSVGRDGLVTLVSPAGVVEEIPVKDGSRTVLRKFGMADVGEWTVTVDGTSSVKAVVRPPVIRPAVTLSFGLEDSQLNIAAYTTPQSFAVFLEGRSDFVKAAGSSIRINLPDFNETRVRAEIVRSQPSIRYTGNLMGVGYSMEIEQIVSSEIVSGRKVEDLMVFSVPIPNEGGGPSGIRPVGIGVHKLRLLSLSDRRIVYEANIVVLPSSKRSLEGLSSTLTVDFWDAMKKNYTLLVGDEAGNLWILTLRLPAAVFRVYDMVHGRFQNVSDLKVPDGTTKILNSMIMVSFMDVIEISDYINQSTIIPSKEVVASISFGPATVNTPAFVVEAGETILLNVTLYQTDVKLVFPNRTIYQGPRLLEINGQLISGKSPLLLPEGTHVVRALMPESFSSETFQLTADTTWTIVVLDNPLGLAGLRASSILLISLLGYSILKTFSIRKTFNRARASRIEHL